MDRRKFIKTTSAFAVGSFIIANPLISCISKQNYIGLQLYTIRDEVSKNLNSTLERVAKIGYNSIEAAGYANRQFYGLKPAEFKKLVNSFGMELHSTHSNISPDIADTVIEDTIEAGIPYLIMPWLAPDKRVSLDSYKKLADDYNIIGEKCKNAGITFAYHNHDFEFETIEGEIPYNLLLDNTEADLVKMQLDLFWIKKAGFDPIHYFEKYPGRFELWHIKDMDDTQAAANIEVGRGIIDFETLLKYKEQAGMKYFFIELDNCILPPFECIELSYNNMKDLL